MPAKSKIIDLFGSELLTRSSHGELDVYIASVPLQASVESRVRPTPVPVLKMQRARKLTNHLRWWPYAGLESKPHPVICCVLAGEADIAFGATDSMAKKCGADSLHGLYQLRMGAGGILVYPSNAPMPDGVKPHWDEAERAQPDCTILWINVITEGVMLHTCHSVKGDHLTGESRLLVNPRLLSQTEALIEELDTPASTESTARVTAEIVKGQLNILFLNIYRSLLEQQSYTALGNPVRKSIEHGLPNYPEPSLSKINTVQRTCEFVQGHLDQQLTVEKLANFAFVSPSQLNRLFRVELGQSVMEYVNNERIKLAEKLLTETSFPISFISARVGFSDASYFGRIFRRRSGLAPLEYRHQNR